MGRVIRNQLRSRLPCPALLAGVLVTLWVIDRLGRKKTMALCFVIFSLCSLLLFICIGRNVLTLLLFIARAFISGGFQAAYVYTPEVGEVPESGMGVGG
eukprot:XP_006257789.1 PREDICTED: synaptic vesicle 2-related protein-like [Rattus norvegicus]